MQKATCDFAPSDGRKAARGCAAEPPHMCYRTLTVSAQCSRRCLFMNKGKLGVRSPKSTFAVLQRPTIERPVDGSWRVLFRWWWSASACPDRSVEIRIVFFCVHERRRWPSGVFMNNAPLGRSVFLTDQPNDKGMRRLGWGQDHPPSVSRNNLWCAFCSTISPQSPHPPTRRPTGPTTGDRGSHRPRTKKNR